MKHLLLFVIIISFINISKGSNYYFSTKLGNDDRTSRQAQNPSTPWKTLSKLNAHFSSLQPGDSVLLKRGEIFYGLITVNKSGTSGLPIVIGAYGAGNRPVITSLVTLSGWTANKTYRGVFESSANPSLSKTVNIILLNGAVQDLGRYPNSDAANKGYLIFESHTGTSSITDNELTSPVNWTGAELVLRTRRWILDRDLITSQSGNTLLYKPSSKYEPKDKYGYFIQNDIRTLDTFGEWYYSSSKKTVSVYFGANVPSAYAIQSSTIENLVSSAGFSNVVFDNLNIKGANASGFNIKNGSNINIKNCDILFSGKDGVKVNNHKNFNITNCTVSHSNNNGIDLGYSTYYAIVRNNKIFNTAVLTGMGGSGDSRGVALFTRSKGAIIEYNEIRNSGYVGINFNGDSSIVKNNYIDSFCLTKDDGSGIYTYETPANSNGYSKKIIGNIIINGIGAGEGTFDPVSSSAEGIYMDNNSSDVEIRDNTVANCSNQGIYIHNAHEISIINNTVFNNNKKQLSMIEMSNHTQIRNCIITDNIFFSRLSSQRVISLKSDDKNVNLFGTFNSNYFATPVDSKRPSIVDKVKGYDKNATIINYNQPPRLEYNATKKNKKLTLNDNYVDTKNNSYSSSIILKPYSSVILLKQTGKKLL